MKNAQRDGVEQLDAHFDRYATSYRAQVDKAIGFLGQGVDFFARAKAKVLLDIARREIGATRRLRVLDIGCGVGLTDRFLIPHVSELHGIDLSRESVRAAQELNPAATYEAYSGDRLPYSDSRFDVAFVFNVIHHVHMPKRAEFVREMARVTQDNGLVIVIEHNPINPLTRLAVNRCSFDDGCELARRRAVEALFVSAGCDIVETRYIMFFPWASRLLSVAESALRHVPFGAQYVVVGRPNR